MGQQRNVLVDSDSLQIQLAHDVSEQSVDSALSWWFPLLVVLHAGIGIAFFAFQNGWGFVNAVYFTVLTLTTIGMSYTRYLHSV